MRSLHLLTWLLISVITITGCRKDKNETACAFDYGKAAGVWVPYESKDELGTVESGPFTFHTIFGSYAESVQLNSDKSFIPMVWISADRYSLRTQEAGTYEYFPNGKLRFQGFEDLGAELVKFEGDELWLKMELSGVLYKLKRQQ